MSGFRTILQRSGYTPGISEQGTEDEARLVVPLRGEQVGEVSGADVLSRFGVTVANAPRDTRVAEIAEEAGEAGEEIDIERLVAEAREEGRREAREELAEAIRGYEVSKTRLEEMVQALDGCREGWAHQLRVSTGDLLLQTLERLVSEVPELLDEHLRKGCELAIEQMLSVQVVDLIVHPDDLGLAEDLIGEREGWAILTDDSIRGGCMVEAPSGRLDATLDAALAAITEAVEGWKKETAPQEGPGT
jgi:flagellar assembly protein FliH